MAPLLSIIIPVYNSEATIRRTMDSLLALPADSREQTEVIVIDDGSRDSSSEIIASYRDRLSPASLVICRQENQGTSAARNKGIDQSTGSWIFFLDADDELYGDLIPSLLQYPDASAVAFSVQYVRNNRRQGRRTPRSINSGNHLDIFSAGNALTVSSIAIKRESILVRFNQDMQFLEDWLFWIMNPQIFNKMVVLRRVFSARIHAHGSGKTSNYEKAGGYRAIIADVVTRELQGRLTRKQKNNFFIQKQIGGILRGEQISSSPFLSFPCSIGLYVKLILYTLLRKKFGRFDKYGKRP